jgi:hypothetical protein
MFLNSGTPATQNVTLIVGRVYTVTVTGAGGGDITGSAGASGTATTGSPATFTATTTTGTFTLTGSLDTIQLNRGEIATAYLATTGSIRQGIPHSYDRAGALYGIVSEPAATNLATQSQVFSAGGSPWASAGVVSNNATAPDNTATGDTVSFTSGSSLTHVPTFTVVGGTIYTASIYLKYTNTQWFFFNFRSAAGADRVRGWIDLQNGVVGSSAAIGSGVYVSHSLTAVGNGWYRAVITGSISQTDLQFQMIATSADASGTAGTGELAAWGAQVEIGSVATSYIQTTTASTTRAVDSIAAAQSTFPAFAAGAGGEASLVYYGKALSIPADTTFIDWGQADGSDAILLYNATTPSAKMFINSGSAGQADFVAGNITINTAYKIAARAALNDFHAAVNGTLSGAPDTSGSFLAGVADNLVFNYQGGGTSSHVFIYQMTALPRALDNTELQTKST